MAVEFLGNEIHRVHRSMALYPEGYLEKNGYSLDAMANIYDPVNNPAGIGLLIFCAFLDDYDLTHSSETDDDLRACDISANSSLTGTTYEISANSRRDRELTAWSANNALFAATMKQDKKWELLDFYGAKDSEKVLPENPFTDGIEWRLYSFSTDYYRDLIENGSKAQNEVALLSEGKLIQSRALIPTGKTIALSYTEPTEFNSNENVDIWVGLPGSTAAFDGTEITVDINEVNNPDLFRNIIGVDYFDGTTFPSATSSDTGSKAVINQDANVSKRGTAQGQCTLQVALPKDIFDTVTTQGWVYNLLDVKPNEEVILPVVTRIAQSPTTKRADLKAGDVVSVYLFKFRIAHRNSTGEDPYFIDSEGSLAGKLAVNVFAVDGTNKLTQTVDFTNLPTVVGKQGVIHSTVNDINTSYAATYSTSNPAVAQVNSTGLVTVVGVGTYTITSHIDGCVDITSTSQTTTAPQVATVDAGQNLPIAGGVATLTGTNLGGISKISVDGDEVSEWSVKSDTELTIVAPAHAVGNVLLQIAGYWDNTVVTEDVIYA